ncbi:MAG: DUF2961 domain-containing protein [Bacteroidota bacterium]|nr:DUF2961 domain-containing protein [Bacteroidota bacterium]MDP4211844.1 DUF2961 domain-containing protein [Bacteroidota bacterium]
MKKAIKIRLLPVMLICIICPPLLRAQELFQMPAGTESRVSSFENLNGLKGRGGITNKGAKGNAYESIKSGESKTLLDIPAAGTIRRIWCTLDDRSPGMLRSLRLRMYWDGSSKPAVDVPLGDFFGAGLGRPVAFQSALFTNPEGRSFNCYIPMPFRKSARIILTNESTKDLNALFFDIDFTTVVTQPKDMLYFHACWNRFTHSAPGNDFEFLPSVSGRGRFLGVNMGVNVDSVYGNTWWGEGEVKMYLDKDSLRPTINGTGSEDYIGTGYGEGTFSDLYQGCNVADGKTRQYAFYRYHIPDPIYFHSRFRAAIQQIGGGDANEVRALRASGVPLIPVSVSTDHLTRLFESPGSQQDISTLKGWMNFYRSDDYSATAYFYLDRPESNLPELAGVSERVK